MAEQLHKTEIMDGFVVINGVQHPICYKQLTKVAPGVTCGEFSFENDSTRDLGVVQITPGSNTPYQLVRAGKVTLECCALSTGTAYILKPDGRLLVEELSPDLPAVKVEIGDVMSIYAGPRDVLVILELCTPPFAEGRFQNLDESDELYQQLQEAILLEQQGIEA